MLLNNLNAFLLGLNLLSIYLHVSLANMVLSIFLKCFYFKIYPTLNFLTFYQYRFCRLAYHPGIMYVKPTSGLNFLHVDIRSFYPAIMQQSLVGISSLKRVSVPKDLLSFCKNSNGFVKVAVRCNPLYPNTFLYKKSIMTDGQYSDELSVLGSGIFRGVFTTAELAYCLECLPLHYEFRPAYALIYSQENTIFSNFIKMFYSLRINYGTQNPYLDYFFKQCLNILLGRFGINVSFVRSKLFSSQEEHLFFSNDLVRVVESKNLFSDLSLISFESVLGDFDSLLKVYYSKVDWASSITSSARIYMHKLLMRYDPAVLHVDALILPEKSIISFLSTYSLNTQDIGTFRFIEYIP